MRFLILLLLASCGSSVAQPPRGAPVAKVEAELEMEDEEEAELDEVPVADELPTPARTMRLRKRASVRAEPAEEAPVIGIIKKDAITEIGREAAGQGACSRWLELSPRGWVCESALEPSDMTAPAPRAKTIDDDLGEAPAVRGTYGVVRKKSAAVAFGSEDDAQAAQNGRALVGSNTVRARGKVTIDGRKFWRTSKGELIDASAIVHLSPSRFRGVRIEDPAELPVWVRARGRAKDPVKLRVAPSRRARVVGELPSKSLVQVLEESEDGKYARVGPEAWVQSSELRRATLAPPPPGTDDDERWFDIDLDEQVLVAYEGARPVYATLVSTGKRKHRTPTAIARVVSKLEHAAMTSERESYSVADVPWTMYYDGDYALHTAYWHDGFGAPRSHGCINLAPHDARLLYHWSSPDVPPGWQAVYAGPDSPGSLVRVRSRKVPAPSFRGYARELHERRHGVTLADAR